MEHWDHTSALLAMLHNVNCTKASHRKDPSKFHPYRRRHRRVRKATKEEIRARLNQFVGVRSKVEEKEHAEREST